MQLSESFTVPAKQMLELVRAHSLEGVVAKRLSSSYEQGRRSGCLGQDPRRACPGVRHRGLHAGNAGFDAVLLGFYRDGQLRFCASVRNGFVPVSRRSLFSRLKAVGDGPALFANLPETGPGRWGQGLTAAKMQKCVWLRPETVAQFRFLEWTPADHLRQVSFRRLRDDKEPNEVVKEGEQQPSRKTRTGLTR